MKQNAVGEGDDDDDDELIFRKMDKNGNAFIISYIYFSLNFTANFIL